ncbi:platelet-activating factor acetylhydrolase, isoform II-domain-containing protein [Pelagophyceae sp. CCMP2097]|nr:platelet-activating factor acetylhydrolase, isoform II-domain-containing protein [Pelagophyceae sp. CCMP2097]
MSGLPLPQGEYRVGVIEVDLPAPGTAAGVVPAAIYYPAAKALDGGAFARPQWLSSRHAAAMGSASMTIRAAFGEAAGSSLMGALGPAASGWCSVQADLDAPPLESQKGAWPLAVFSHGLIGWKYLNSAFAAELASRGSVVVALEHADGSACTCLSTVDGRELASFLSLAHLDVEGDAPGDAALRLERRRQQTDQRRTEVLAACESVNAALEKAFGVSDFARSHQGVAVLGQSFGGATAAVCALRDDRALFSACLVYDPWIEGGDGAITVPWRSEDLDAAAFPPSCRTLAIWRNGKSGLFPLCGANMDALRRKMAGADDSADEAGSRVAAVAAVTAVMHDFETCGHFAQTDVPVVFESGALAFIYRALVDKNEGAMGAAEALDLATRQTVEALQGWLHS